MLAKERRGNKQASKERELPIPQAAPAMLHGRGIAYRHYDTCVGYGSHRRTPRHGNGGRHYKTYGAVANRRLMQPLKILSENQKSALIESADFVV